MPNYYVSALDGSDSTGDGSAANPWATIGKAIGSSPAITTPLAAPTTLWLAPGTYWEAVTLGVAPSASNPLAIKGDCDGAAFLAGGKSSPRKGVVDWRAWTNNTTSINDYAFQAASKSNVSLERLKVTSGGKAAVFLNQTGSAAIRDCVLTSGVAGVNVVEARIGSASAGLEITRCRLVGGGHTALSLSVPLYEEASAYSANVVVADCAFEGGYRHVSLSRQSGSGGNLGSGITVRGCSFRNSSQHSVYVTAALPAAAVDVSGCVFLQIGTALQAQTLGQIVEDGNVFSTVLTPRTNVSAGVNSVVDVFPAFNFGDAMLDGSRLRPWLEPLAGSTFIGFGRFGSPSATDLFGRARPANPAAVAAGSLERAADPPGPACPPIGNTYIFQCEG